MNILPEKIGLSIGWGSFNEYEICKQIKGHFGACKSSLAMVLLSRLIAMFLHISLLMVGVALNEASAQQVYIYCICIMANLHFLHIFFFLQCGPPTLVSVTPQYNATSSSDPLVMK